MRTINLKYFYLLIFLAVSVRSIGQEQRLVMIETPMGNMKVALYNETPKHRDNFVALVKDGFYDSTLFHRVIDDFMIQGGDPESINSKPGKKLGDGGPGYKIEAEFVDTIYHKKGVLAAAREMDRINPARKSSGSQFYLVEGKVFTKEELKKMEQMLMKKAFNNAITNYLAKPENDSLRTKYKTVQRSQNREMMESFYDTLKLKVEDKVEHYRFSEEQIETYTTIGGTPHLDDMYTVYGEIVEGIEVLEKIASVEVDGNNRPKKDIWMRMKMLN